MWVVRQLTWNNAQGSQKKREWKQLSSLPPAPPWPDQKEEDGDRGRKFQRVGSLKCAVRRAASQVEEGLVKRMGCRGGWNKVLLQ